MISAEDFGKGIETIRNAAKQAGRDASKLELTIWPASFDFTKTFDLDFVKSYVERGAHRVVVSANESMTTDIDGQRDFIRRYQDSIVAKL